MSGAFELIQFRGGVRATVESGIVTRTNRRGWPAVIYGTERVVEVAGDQIATEKGFPAVGGDLSRPWLRARVKGQDGLGYIRRWSRMIPFKQRSKLSCMCWSTGARTLSTVARHGMDMRS